MNPHRGEVAVKLGGKEYILRPTFEAMVEVEQRTATPLVPLVRRFANRQFGLQDVVAIVAAGIRGAGAPVPENVGELVLRAGIATLAGPVTEFLRHAIAGDADPGNGEAPGALN